MAMRQSPGVADGNLRTRTEETVTLPQSFPIPPVLSTLSKSTPTPLPTRVPFPVPTSHTNMSNR